MNMHIFLKIHQSRQILSGRQNKQRQSEFNLAITLISIVLMHIVCNALRVFLGVLVVALVDVQVSCIKHVDQYIPPLWVMCLESVAHLLVMLNFSSNFLIYCSVSTQFKAALSKVCLLCFQKSSPPPRMEASVYQQLPASMAPQLSNTTLELVDIGTDQEVSQTNESGTHKNENEGITVQTGNHQLKIGEH